jgi:hypothetical protein
MEYEERTWSGQPGVRPRSVPPFLMLLFPNTTAHTSTSRLRNLPSLLCFPRSRAQNSLLSYSLLSCSLLRTPCSALSWQVTQIDDLRYREALGFRFLARKVRQDHFNTFDSRTAIVGE